MLKQISIGLTLALALALIPFTASSMIHYGSEDSAPVITYQQPNPGTPVTFDAKMWGNALRWEHETTGGYTIVHNYGTGYW